MKSLLVCLVLAFTSPVFAAVDMAEMQAMIPKFRQVTPSIYAGGNPSSKSDGRGLNAMAMTEIYTILSLQGADIDKSFYGWVNSYREPGEHAAAVENERLFWEFQDREWLNAPLNSHVPVSQEADVLIRGALEAMNRATPEKPLYLHCEHGADRTGLLIALYRVIYQGWSKEEAWNEWVLNGHSRVSRLITGDLDVYFYRLIEELAPQTVARAQVSEEECALRATR